MRKRTPTPLVAQSQPVVLETLLTVNDVAAKLQVSRVLVYQLIRSEGLPSLKIKGARRIEPAALHNWIEQQREAS
ncbi:MAG: helix-turn-helix domain-containing protein [Ktedonobacteraceae bacterium]